MNSGNPLEKFGNKKLNNVNNNIENRNHNSNTIMKRTSRKTSNEESISSSRDIGRQINYFSREPNESVNSSKKNINLNVTPREMVNTFNEKLDLNKENDISHIKTGNNLNPITETRNRFEEEEKSINKKSIIRKFNSPRKNNNNHQVISEKEKRTILEHFRKLYSFEKDKKERNHMSAHSADKQLQSFPLISQFNKVNILKSNKKDQDSYSKIEYPNFNKTLSIFNSRNNKNINLDNIEDNVNKNQKNSMFRCSIYSNLMPSNSQFYKKSKNSGNFDWHSV